MRFAFSSSFAACRAQVLPAAIDEGLNHPDTRPNSTRRHILTRHRPRDLGGRARECAAWWMRGVSGHSPDPLPGFGATPRRGGLSRGHRVVTVVQRLNAAAPIGSSSSTISERGDCRQHDQHYEVCYHCSYAHQHAESLCRRKVGEEEERKSRRDDEHRGQDRNPQLRQCLLPRVPHVRCASFEVPDSVSEVNHLVDAERERDICGGCRMMSTGMRSSPTNPNNANGVTARQTAMASVIRSERVTKRAIREKATSRPPRPRMTLPSTSSDSSL